MKSKQKKLNDMDSVLNKDTEIKNSIDGQTACNDEREQDERAQTVNIIGVNTDAGAGERGMGLGPWAIRLSGLVDMLMDAGYYVSDYGDVSHTLGCSNFTCEYACNYECNCADDIDDDDDERGAKKLRSKGLKNLWAVNRINTRLYNSLLQVLQEDGFPLILGGDHSLAAATITAMQAHHKKIGVIWVDAHGDFNDEISSPTGNIHGMPLSAVTGNGPEQILPFRSLLDQYIDTRNTVIIGGRDFDRDEARRIERARITVFSEKDVEREGMAEIAQKAIAIAGKGTAGIYLSFDVDALDPLYAPGVGTPVDGGLSQKDGEILCAALFKSGKLLGAEIVETDPILDQKNKTGQAALKLISALLVADSSWERD